jgi:predicted permease
VVVFRDLRHAIRRLRNSPAFSAVAIATIALAIGANTATFSFVNALLLRPLPYPDPHRIVRLAERPPGGGLNGISTENYLDWSRQNSVFEYVAAEASWRATLTGGDEPTLIRGVRVSAHYFDIFRVKPPLGRTFREGEDAPGNDRVVMLSHRLWERRFGADPAIVGRRLLLDGDAYTVIGVLPKGPFDRASAQMWKPLAFEPANMTRDFRWLGASATLRPGVTLERAREEMAVIGHRLAAAYPASNKGWGVAVDRLEDVLIGPQMRTAVTVLFAATMFVLLIGCANLANLALARGMSRESEMAVRAALGATRRRLVRELLSEHLVISICAGIVAVGVGYLFLRGIQSLIPPDLLPPAVDVGLDRTVLLFTFIAAIFTGVIFGAVPAARATSRSPADSLKKSGHGTTTSSPGRRVRGVLVVAEIALAFVLLVGSGLLMRSFFKLLEVNPGFDPTNVLTANLPIVQEQYREPVRLNAYLAAIRTAVDAVAGVRETALASALPLEGWGYGVPYAIAGRTPVEQGIRRPAFFKVVSPSYFDALGIKLNAGRLLTDNDGPGAPPAAVINETLARREFSDDSPIGQRILVPEITPGRTGFGKPIAWEIVGVIADEKINDLVDETSAGLYVSNQQSPTYGISLIVRASVPPQALEKTIRSVIAGVNRDQPLSDVRTLEQVVAQSMRGNRVMSTLLAMFSAMALSLAVVGIYGIVSYSAVQRTREIGIRAAVGASGGSLCRLILRDAMQLALAGLGAGLVVMIPAADVLSTMLYGVGTYDPPTIAVVAVVLLAVAALASFLPAWRMMQTDPMKALRYQ